MRPYSQYSFASAIFKVIVNNYFDPAYAKVGNLAMPYNYQENSGTFLTNGCYLTFGLSTRSFQVITAGALWDYSQWDTAATWNSPVVTSVPPDVVIRALIKMCVFRNPVGITYVIDRLNDFLVSQGIVQKVKLTISGTPRMVVHTVQLPVGSAVPPFEIISNFAAAGIRYVFIF